MTAATWHTDPWDPNQLRYWDGQQWTAFTAPAQTAAYAAPVQTAAYAAPAYASGWNAAPTAPTAPSVVAQRNAAPTVQARGYVFAGATTFARKQPGTVTLADGRLTFQYDTGEIALSVTPSEVKYVSLVSDNLRVARVGHPTLNIFLSNSVVDEYSSGAWSAVSNTGIGLIGRQASVGFGNWIAVLRQHGFPTHAWPIAKVMLVTFLAMVPLVLLFILAVAVGAIH